MEEEFDRSLLDALLDHVLAERGEAAAELASAQDNPSVKEELGSPPAELGRPGRRLLSFTDSQMCAAFASVLPKFLPADTVGQVFDEMREVLTPGPVEDIRIFHQKVSRCRRCEGATCSPALPYGNLTDPAAVFVCEHADAVADVADLIAESDLDIGGAAIVPLARCKPATTEMRGACEPYLRNELGIWKPRVVVCVGAAVAGQLIGPDVKLGDLLGRVQWADQVAVIAVGAPAYVRREQWRLRDALATLHQISVICTR